MGTNAAQALLAEDDEEQHNMSLPIIKNPRDVLMQEELAAAGKGASGYKLYKTPAKVQMKDTIQSSTTLKTQSASNDTHSYQTP